MCRGAAVSPKARVEIVPAGPQQVEGPLADAAGVEAGGQRRVEGGLHVEPLAEGGRHPAQHRQLRRQAGAALGQAAVEVGLLLELPHHAPVPLGLHLGPPGGAVLLGQVLGGQAGSGQAAADRLGHLVSSGVRMTKSSASIWAASSRSSRSR